MANDDHLAILQQGVEVWNAWRQKHGNILRSDFIYMPDLVGADLKGKKLAGVNFSKTKLNGADLSGADLTGANLSGAFLINARLLNKAILIGADLTDAILLQAELAGADLTGAKLVRAYLSASILNKTIFVGAKLDGATLHHTLLVEADLTDATLNGCRVYGISAWDLKLKGAMQNNLIITKDDQPEITVDNLEVAQFIYLLFNNERVRHVIDTITSKVVLILGRFTPERKAVLDALREELRKRDYLPVLFDFEKPTSRSTDETVTLLARMARFVVADITDAKSVLQELRGIVPELPSVPVQPLILAPQEEPGMFDFFVGYRSVLDVHRYDSPERLIADLGERVIGPAEAKVEELRMLRAG